jgi:hypothetical protein
MATQKVKTNNKPDPWEDGIPTKETSYLDAMRIATTMVDMCDTHTELLQVLEHLNEILKGSIIEAIFTRSW